MDDRRHPEPDDGQERTEDHESDDAPVRREGRGGGTPHVPVERAVNAPEERR